MERVERSAGSRGNPAEKTPFLKEKKGLNDRKGWG